MEGGAVAQIATTEQRGAPAGRATTGEAVGVSYDPKDLRPGDCILTVGRERLTLGGAMDLGIEGATDCPFDHCAMAGEGVLLEQLITMTASPLDKYTENGWRFTPPLTLPTAVRRPARPRKPHPPGLAMARA